MENNALTIFQNEQFGRVRTYTDNDGIVWFVGKDIAIALGYANPSEALLYHVDEDDKLNSKNLLSCKYNGEPNNELLSSLGQRGGWLINRYGLYSLVLSSKLPNAKQFKRWITHEVLPSIEETGSYSVNKENLPTQPIPEFTPEQRDYIDSKFESLEKFFRKEMKKDREATKDELNLFLVNFMAELKNENPKEIDEASRKITVGLWQKHDKYVNGAEKAWKNSMYALMDRIVPTTVFPTKNVLFKYIYQYMNKHYGICWSQEIKDYREKYHMNFNPKTFDIVYDKEMYQSIFESILKDLVARYGEEERYPQLSEPSQNKQEFVQITLEDNPKEKKENPDDTPVHSKKKCKYHFAMNATPQEIIKPLATIHNDNSPYGLRTFRMIYKHMDLNDHLKVNWDNLSGRYKKKYGTKCSITRTMLINESKVTKDKFKRAVRELITQEETQNKTQE